ncbi:MAG: zinc ABC transporter substrate-binding protein [Rhodobiaceae bacterium]|nr:zinc ABC transporter substrate-binding protein [Rhodobiaceae bacterium]MCC0060964.1 zinc ABC transporter substrate-binding protein [Rhodobiaceae bacterium]
MNIRSLVLAVGGFLAIGALSPAMAMDGVVASIKPVYSLVAAVMGDTGSPELIVEGAGSPHTYSLKPSQARMLENAKLVFWIGHDLEAFLEKPLETLSHDAQVVALSKAEGLKFLELREGGTFEGHDHGHEGHDQDEHAEHEDHDAHGEEHADHDHDHEGEEHAHHHGEEIDVHIWLDPRNAAAMVQAIADALAKADPGNAETYLSNADLLTVSLSRLEDEIGEALAPVHTRSFIVFHDAYQYFEQRFGLHVAGSVTVNPEVMPGAERIAEIHAKVSEVNSVCVFSEPQFEPKILAAITEGTSTHSGTLDPLGASLEDGPNLYFTLMRNMAAEIRGCLAGEG